MYEKHWNIYAHSYLNENKRIISDTRTVTILCSQQLLNTFAEKSARSPMKQTTFWLNFDRSNQHYLSVKMIYL